MTEEAVAVPVAEGICLPALDTHAQYPIITSLNVTKKSRLHLGPKFVTVTQNVTQDHVVKELSFPQYLLHAIKKSTRAELIGCVSALLSLFVCGCLIIYFTVMAKKDDIIVDVAPHEWNITRAMWLALPPKEPSSTEQYQPLRLVVINHSVSNECHRFINCAAELRNLQTYFVEKLNYDDLPYNFVVGNDGRVYEGRGWGVEGAHAFHYNKCSLGIGFIGDYREEYMNTQVTTQQVTRIQQLFDFGVHSGFLHPHYVVVGGRDLKPSASPGLNLYKEILTWEHYDRHTYHNMSCDEIHAYNETFPEAGTSAKV